MKKIAIVTVTTQNFLPGTIVMLHSFLTNNPWFKGNVYIIHDELEEKYKNLINAVYPVEFIQVSGEISRNIKKLIPDYNDFERRKAQFYSIELFEIENEESILFLDSDMLIRSDISEIQEWGSPFYACGTVNKYKKDYLNPIINPFDIETFNAGFMLLDPSIRTKSIKQELIGMISQRFFNAFITYAKNNNIPRVGSDQIILNTFFKDKTTYISGKYNYRVGISNEIELKDNIKYKDASIIHYTGSKKPWMMDKIIQQLSSNNQNLKIFIEWQSAWLDTLNYLKPKA